MSDYSDVKVGAVLKDGYCQGIFEYDFYHEHQIEALGVDWVVTRDERGNCNFACKTHDELFEVLHVSINYIYQEC